MYKSILNNIFDVQKKALDFMAPKVKRIQSPEPWDDSEDMPYVSYNRQPPAGFDPMGLDPMNLGQTLGPIQGGGATTPILPQYTAPWRLQQTPPNNPIVPPNTVPTTPTPAPIQGSGSPTSRSDEIFNKIESGEVDHGGAVDYNPIHEKTQEYNRDINERRDDLINQYEGSYQDLRTFIDRENERRALHNKLIGGQLPESSGLSQLGIGAGPGGGFSPTGVLLPYRSELPPELFSPKQHTYDLQDESYMPGDQWNMGRYKDTGGGYNPTTKYAQLNSMDFVKINQGGVESYNVVEGDHQNFKTAMLKAAVQATNMAQHDEFSKQQTAKVFIAGNNVDGTETVAKIKFNAGNNSSPAVSAYKDVTGYDPGALQAFQIYRVNNDVGQDWDKGVYDYVINEWGNIIFNKPLKLINSKYKDYEVENNIKLLDDDYTKAISNFLKVKGNDNLLMKEVRTHNDHNIPYTNDNRKKAGRGTLTGLFATNSGIWMDQGDYRRAYSNNFMSTAPHDNTGEGMIAAVVLPLVNKHNKTKYTYEQYMNLPKEDRAELLSNCPEYVGHKDRVNDRITNGKDHWKEYDAPLLK